MTATFVSLTPDELASLAASSRFVRLLQPSYSAEQARARLSEVTAWYHSMYLGHGVVATGVRDTQVLLGALDLPGDLHGKTVLDIGSAEGFFSFECEARGAERVVALDLPPVGAQGERATMELLVDLFRSRVEMVEGDIEEEGTLAPVQADVVLFLGVLYHLKDPFLALRRLRQVTREALYLESHVVNATLPKLAAFGEDEPPFAVFYERDELAGDPFNWWGPNVPCLKRMLRAAGFGQIEVLRHTRRDEWQGRAVLRATP